MFEKVIVPAGSYVLGDPCYCFPDRQVWMSLLESCNCFENPTGKVSGYSVFAFSTKYGYGVYYDQFRNSYPIDAGLIGLVPVALIDFMGVKQPEGTIVVEFSEDTICSNQDGVLVFGNYDIDTIGDGDGWGDSDFEDSDY